MSLTRNILVIVLALISVNVKVSAAETDRTNYDYMFLEAVAEGEQGNYAASFDMLRRCLELRPDAPEAHYYIASLYTKLKDKESALEEYEKAAERDRDNLDYLYMLARMYIANGRYDDAILTLENYMVKNSGELEVLEMLVTLYAQSPYTYQKAVDALNRIEELEGKSEHISSVKCDIYAAMGDKTSAVKEMKALSEQFPSDLGCKGMYADMLLLNGENDAALAVYDDILTEDPENGKVLMSLRDYYKRISEDETSDSLTMLVLGNQNITDEEKVQIIRQEIGDELSADTTENFKDSQRMLRFFSKAMAAEETPGSMVFLCASYMSLREMPQDTINILLREVIRRAPDHAPARLKLVQAAWDRNDMDEAVELCAAARQYNPEEMVFYYYQGIALYKMEKEDLALEAFRNGISVINDESNPSIVSDFYAIMGDILYQKGLVNEAYEAYDSCLVWQDDNYGCLNNYAYFLSEKGERLEEAESMSYRTIRAEPKNATYLDTYAWILFKQNRFAEAKVYIEQALQNDADTSAVIIEHAGDISAMNEDIESAIDLWERSLECDPENALLRRKIKQKKYIEE